MIPFFIMVWGCVIWASQSFENEIDLAAKTREHAWQHAMNNCNGPSGASDGTQVTSYSGGGIMGAVSEVTSLIDQVIGLFSFASEWPGLSFDEHEYVRQGVVPSPEVAGGEDRQTYYHDVLMCNEEHDTPDIEETAWKAFTVFGF